MKEQKIIIFGGPDRCGKTTLAKALASKWEIPYYKPVNQQWIAKNEPSIFKRQTQWAEPKLLDFIKQTGQSVIFDRSFPCDYVYSKVFNRDTAFDTIRELDAEYATLNALLVFTLRPDYTEVVDDWDKITLDSLRDLDKQYREYAKTSRITSTLIISGLKLDDYNIQKQLEQITFSFNFRKVK